MWIGVVSTVEWLLVEFCLCGIGGWCKKLKSVSEITIACSLRNVEDNFSWAFVGIYCPNFDRNMRLLWDELVGLLSWWNLPWCIMGDFNVS